ncbi:MAG: hypothetical protein WD451_07690, partial [Thermoanaerobaculia bacterium]
RIMDTLVQSYGATDWSAVVEGLVARPWDPTNPNIMVIPLSLGNVYLNRYETGGDVANFEMALFYVEWTADNYWVWGQRWLTPAVAQYLAVSLLRLRAHETAGVHDRIDALWEQTAVILVQEADARLLADLPYRNSPGVGNSDPYDSAVTGDTRAEENAWEAGILAAASSFLPDHPHAGAWDQKARQLAYDAITRASDPPDAFGVKTTTVSEDFTLANHGSFPSPYYMAATLFLLSQGALSYQLAGRPVPEEFQHNVPELFAKYRTYVDAELRWTVPSDPHGDATLFPLTLDPDFEAAIVLQKAASGYLWEPTGPVTQVSWGPDLWRAIQNSKVVLYYLMGSYFWHVPPLRVEGPVLP